VFTYASCSTKKSCDRQTDRQKVQLHKPDEVGQINYIGEYPLARLVPGYWGETDSEIDSGAEAEKLDPHFKAGGDGWQQSPRLEYAEPKEETEVLGPNFKVIVVDSGLWNKLQTEVLNSYFNVKGSDFRGFWKGSATKTETDPGFKSGIMEEERRNL